MTQFVFVAESSRPKKDAFGERSILFAISTSSWAKQQCDVFLNALSVIIRKQFQRQLLWRGQRLLQVGVQHIIEQTQCPQQPRRVNKSGGCETSPIPYRLSQTGTKPEPHRGARSHASTTTDASTRAAREEDALAPR